MVELEVWGGEGLSAGKLVCLMEVASSASAAGPGGQEVGGDGQVPASREQEVEEVVKPLHWQERRWEVEGVSGPSPLLLVSEL